MYPGLDSQSQLPFSDAYYRTLPKIELHRHLEGSIRFETIRELVHQRPSPSTQNQNLQAVVQILPDQPHTSSNLFAKFNFFRSLFRSEEIIRRIVHEAIIDAVQDNVIHLELRFTPTALSQAGEFPLEDVIDWVITEQHLATRNIPITISLIASLNRHENIKTAQRVTELAVERKQDGLIGLDLAGDEDSFPAQPFLPLFRYAKNQGLKICLHAGEWLNGKSISEAIEIFEADRVGHGIRVLHSPSALQAGLKTGVVFEVCPTSNILSGAAQDYATHPLKSMLERGLTACINTDNPTINEVTLSREYQLAIEKIHLNPAQLKQCAIAAARAAFVTPTERQQLLARITASLS